MIWISLILVVVIVFLVVLYFKIKDNKLNSPAEVTKNYLEKYIKLDKEIISNIKFEYKDNLNDDQKNIFAKAIRRQYEKMGYSILNEEINNDKAIIKTEVTVFDYNNCWNNAEDYVNIYAYRFSDEVKKVDYKLSQMTKCKEKVTYNIKFNFIKKNNKWEMSKLSNDDIRKINGIY